MPLNTGATSVSQLPYPQLPDKAHPDNVKELADYLDTRIVMRFASAAARNAAIGSPVEGQAAWLADVDKLTVYNGSAWKNIASGAMEDAWTSWTPTVSNWTRVNGALNCAYRIVGKTASVRIMWTLGSSDTKHASLMPSFSLPFTVKSGLVATGTAALSDGGSPVYLGRCYAVTTTLSVECVLANGTYAASALVTATAPFTWVTGDVIIAQIDQIELA